MQNVSALYKQAMKETLRERSYMRVTLGVVNHEAQNRASLSHEETTYFSSDKLIGTTVVQDSYAAFDCCSASGKQYLLPENGELLMDTGLLSQLPVSQDPFEVLLTFSAPVDVKGITLGFDENAYPTEFTIQTDNGTTAYTNETGAEWVTEDSFEFISFMRFRFTKMSLETSRLRMKSILFGYGLIYTNDDILDSEWKTFVSEVSEDMPQVDFTVTLKNYDQYFDPDNPSSVINYLDSSMPMQVHYGMTLPNGEIEWFQAANCYISEWSSDNRQAVITGTDVLRTMEEKYSKGQVRPNGISLYALAEDVFKDAGIEGYYIDPYLEGLFTKNPIPRVTHKEALQIIANAARCVLSISREGIPQIVSSFLPDLEMSVNAEAPWSHFENIKEKQIKQRYALFHTDFISSDNMQVYLSPENGVYDLYTGFVSAEISRADCTFTNTPTIIITQETATQRVGLSLRFGQVIPARILIETYHDGNRVEYHTITDISKEMYLSISFKAFDAMYVRFLETQKPYQPVEVEYMNFEKVSDFTLDKNDMLSYPISTNERSVKRIDTVAFFYGNSDVVDNLFSEEVTVSSGEEMTFYIEEPCYNYTAAIETGEACSIVESGAYYVKIRFASGGTFKLNISGNKYNVTTSVYSQAVQQRGDVKTWENPLICDMNAAKELTEWLAAYYQNNIVYEFDTRGNPELDPNDIIYQESKYVDNMRVRICKQVVRFNGSLSGRLVTRRTT